MPEKKTWFIAYNYRTWVPVSIEGWIYVIAQIGAICLILWGNGFFDREQKGLNLETDYPMVLEVIAVVLFSLFIAKGHVEKRY